MTPPHSAGIYYLFGVFLFSASSSLQAARVFVRRLPCRGCACVSVCAWGEGVCGGAV